VDNGCGIAEEDHESIGMVDRLVLSSSSLSNIYFSAETLYIEARGLRGSHNYVDFWLPWRSPFLALRALRESDGDDCNVFNIPKRYLSRNGFNREDKDQEHSRSTGKFCFDW
jgi:hypothetical protein